MTAPGPELGELLPGEWRRLDPRTVAASTIVVTGSLAAAAVPVAVGLLLNGLGLGWVLLWTIGSTLLGGVATAVGEYVRLAATAYRVDAHRIERRVRFIASTTSSLSTGRVRNVELSADLVQRWLGIATVKLASGETDGSRLTLAALDRTVAEELRRRLLADRAEAETSEIARIDPAWVRYAPASVATPLFAIFGIGGLFQVADWFDSVPLMLEWFWDLVGELPLPVIVIGVATLVLLGGALASVALFVESWWGMRLDHHRDGSLEMRRGLLVGRHTTFDGRRVRGVTLHEPPAFRALGAARLDVVAVGVGIGKDEDGKAKQSPALIPASPRSMPAGVARSVLGAELPTTIRTHPPAARRRRLLRAALATAALTAIAVIPALVWPWLWWVPPATLVVVGALTFWVAIDNYRGLGHAVAGTQVSLRKGSFLRRTDVLTRDGLLGWNLRRTPFQRRAGLVTLIATSAGGSGAFRLPDVAACDASRLWPTAGTVWDHLTVDPPAGPAH